MPDPMSHGGNPVANPIALVWILIQGAIDAIAGAIGLAIVPIVLIAVGAAAWMAH